MQASSTPGSEALGLARRIGAVLALDPGAPAIEFEGRWHTWRAIAQVGDDVIAALDDLGADGAGTGEPVGILLRNDPASIGLLLGVLRARACAVVLNPALGAARLADDLDGLDLSLITGSRADLDTLVPAAVAGRVATLSVGSAAFGARCSLPNHTSESRALPGVAIRMITSGINVPPERIDLRATMLESVLRGATHDDADPIDDLRLRDGVVIVHEPLVHVAGIFGVLQAVLDGHRIALSSELAEAFTARYGVPVVSDTFDRAAVRALFPA